MEDRTHYGNTAPADKYRENRARRHLTTLGFTLNKVRDGGYLIRDNASNLIQGFDMTLSGVEAFFERIENGPKQ